MANPAFLLCLAVAVVAAAGCSAETAQRTAYETLQNAREQDCMKSLNSQAGCGKRDSYDEYQRQRKQATDAAD
jgi:hypothetical protein